MNKLSIIDEQGKIYHILDNVKFFNSVEKNDIYVIYMSTKYHYEIIKKIKNEIKKNDIKINFDIESFPLDNVNDFFNECYSNLPHEDLDRINSIVETKVSDYLKENSISEILLLSLNPN